MPKRKSPELTGLAMQDRGGAVEAVSLATSSNNHKVKRDQRKAVSHDRK